LVLRNRLGTLVEREVVGSTDVAADREEDQQEEIDDKDGGYAAVAILTAGQVVYLYLLNNPHISSHLKNF